MFENTAIKLTSSKLASTSASLLPGTVILVSGIVVWRLWHNQSKLQTKTSQLNNELKYLKKQIADIKAADKEDSFSSSLKKMANFNIWPRDK